jgi:hypothetical protein
MDYSNVVAVIRQNGAQVVHARSYGAKGFADQTGEFTDTAIDTVYAPAFQRWNVEKQQRAKAAQAAAQQAALNAQRAAELERRQQMEQRAAASLARYKQFTEKTDMQARPAIDDLMANPFVYQGKNVGIVGRFDTMLTADRAIIDVAQRSKDFPFMSDAIPVLVSSIPQGTFRSSGVVVMLIGTVAGKEPIEVPTGGHVLVPHLKYVDAYFCKEAQCADLLYWENHSASN